MAKPWVMRTYAGHSSAAASNELYRTNLSKGQTGLSIAFDLPTQTGYDPDSAMARGEAPISGSASAVRVMVCSAVMAQCPIGLRITTCRYSLGITSERAPPTFICSSSAVRSASSACWAAASRLAKALCVGP